MSQNVIEAPTVLVEAEEPQKNCTPAPAPEKEKSHCEINVTVTEQPKVEAETEKECGPAKEESQPEVVIAVPEVAANVAPEISVPEVVEQCLEPAEEAAVVVVPVEAASNVDVAPQEIEQEQCEEPAAPEVKVEVQVESETCAEPVPEAKPEAASEVEVIVVPTESAQNVIDTPKPIESEQCDEPVEAEAATPVAVVVPVEAASNVVVAPQEIEQEQCAEPAAPEVKVEVEVESETCAEPAAPEAPEAQPEVKVESETCTEPAPEAKVEAVPEVEIIVVPTESAQNVIDTPKPIESEQCDEPVEAEAAAPVVVVVPVEAASNVVAAPQEAEHCAEPAKPAAPIVKPAAPKLRPQPAAPKPQSQPAVQPQVVITSEASQNVVSAPVAAPKAEADCAPKSQSSQTTSIVSSQNVATAPNFAPSQQAAESSSSSAQSQSQSQATSTTTATSSSNASGDVPYYEVSTSLIGSDALADKLLNYGLAHVVQVANSNNTITDLNFQIVKVNSLYKRIIGNRIYYKYDIEVKNSQGVTIDTNFVVRYCESINSIHWISYTYNIYFANEDQSSNTNYVSLSPAQYNTAAVKELISEGSVYVINQASKQGVPAGNYQVKQVIEAQEKQANGASYYNFCLDLIMADGSYELSVVFTIRCGPDGDTKVISYNFNGHHVSK